jgi:hypothetical protein
MDCFGLFPVNEYEFLLLVVAIGSVVGVLRTPGSLDLQIERKGFLQNHG